jgi:hypothetical protein
MRFNSPVFFGRALTMLPGLVNHRRSQQLRCIEVAKREPLEPCLLPTRQALELRPPNIPQLDVHTIGTALAEQEYGHLTSLAVRRTKGKSR